MIDALSVSFLISLFPHSFSFCLLKPESRLIPPGPAKKVEAQNADLDRASRRCHPLPSAGGRSGGSDRLVKGTRRIPFWLSPTVCSLGFQQWLGRISSWLPRMHGQFCKTTQLNK